MTEPLFPELVIEVADPLPAPCKWPIFLVAYWPRGKYWSIKEPLTCTDENSPTLQGAIGELQEKGWQHITIMRLPTTGPWSKKQ